MDYTAHIPVEAGSNRAFALLFALIFLGIALYPWAMAAGDVRIWALIIALVLGLCGFVIPQIFHYPNQYWIKFGLLLGRITSPIIIGLLFFMVVTPIAILSRLTGSDPLRLKRSVRRSDTYWVKRQSDEGEAVTMARQY